VVTVNGFDMVPCVMFVSETEQQHRTPHEVKTMYPSDWMQKFN